MADADITKYTNLITSEHASAPNYMAALAALVQPIANQIQTLKDMPAKFDLDTAIGDQLDAVGARVGKTRFLETPLTNVFFSWDTTGLGWEEGYWQGPFDPDTGITRLEDEPYRTLLYATIAANNWDGTIPGAYAAWQTLFQGQFNLLIQDHGDMSMSVGVVVPADFTWDPVTKALLLSGALNMRPAGVLVDGYFQGSIPNNVIFSWDVDATATEGGWDIGVWAIPLT